MNLRCKVNLARLIEQARNCQTAKVIIGLIVIRFVWTKKGPRVVHLLWVSRDNLFDFSKGRNVFNEHVYSNATDYNKRSF